ncbi:lipoate--protein ligase family protein [Candidatus Bathyarchaeota archaeon]|nr:lipoate--protein ligase family protein [Candidatus Bathyarchaeota archaeon]
MPEVWRTMGLDTYDAYMNMAIDEAICRLRSQEKSPNTIRFYRWKPSAVSIGYFQIPDQEVNLEECRKLGIDVIRRMTGGGAVYHAYEGEVTYSVIVDEGNLLIPKDIIESYELLCSGIVNGLKSLGIESEFKPVNDIVVRGKKISGNAQTRRWGVVVQHGTVLVDTDIETMFKVLKVSKEKISDKLIKSVKDRVTTIRLETGQSISFDEVTEALKKSFPDVLGVKVFQGQLSEEEKALAERLRREKYGARKWIFDRPDKNRTWI